MTLHIRTVKHIFQRRRAGRSINGALLVYQRPKSFDIEAELCELALHALDAFFELPVLDCCGLPVGREVLALESFGEGVGKLHDGWVVAGVVGFMECVAVAAPSMAVERRDGQ